MCVCDCAEISNPLLQLRWFLIDLGYKGTPLHRTAEFAFAGVFLFCRWGSLCLFPLLSLPLTLTSSHTRTEEQRFDLWFLQSGVGPYPACRNVAIGEAAHGVCVCLFACMRVTRKSDGVCICACD